MRQNISVFDFILNPADEAAISALDRGESAAVDSSNTGN
jgi:2,5-diketo-D-gluconate reductase A